VKEFIQHDDSAFANYKRPSKSLIAITSDFKYKNTRYAFFSSSLKAQNPDLDSAGRLPLVHYKVESVSSYSSM